MAENLVEIQNLLKVFSLGGGLLGGGGGEGHRLIAVNDVSLSIKRGETLGLVGESGCGKTTLARSLLRLIEPTAGRVLFEGRDILTLSGRELRQLRRRMQIVFQDPFASLNPRMTVKTIIGDPLLIHRIARGRELTERVASVLESVGLRPDDMNRYPHQFSGGQRQRIGIARAIILNPDFLVLDEPVSALDVSIQAQIVNLLADLQGARNLTYLFVAHDLAVIEHISARVAVMYLGRMVELASSKELIHSPAHPYARLLLQSVPVPDPSFKVKTPPRGESEAPSAVHIPPGCAFHPRCPYAIEECRREVPALREVGRGSDHTTACLRAEEVLRDPWILGPSTPS